ncbi:RagB/SusD family nutrient uptake outer membrane protein [Thalassobellus suaedae]|uniref:RagB/SusD family nutrient uptake outer membrane protein n=1 Tax=Thalassobellus suaedae TaxID=3074124 RepID=A0ABY9Y1G5_9FLAO|nr:RagB/SusD family nutrient uptake outer membrane protein [Flavobacteriaceae bacterium HL-DH10]
MIHFIIKPKVLAMAVITCCMLSFTSCSEEEFLTVNNPNSITDATFWKTSTQFNNALNAVYGAMQFQAISGSGLSQEIIRADIADTYSFFGRWNIFRQLTYTDNSEQLVNKWNQLYIGIFRANQVINNIEIADSSIFKENEKESILAQAKCLRAFFYFELVHTYGQAVIHTEVSAANLNKPTSTIEEVNDQVIIPDLNYARLNLPKIWTDSKDLGRVTSGTATSLRGKVYLYDQQWGLAANDFKEVIDSNVYALTPEALDNFTDQNEFNSESILEVAYSATANPGANGANVDDTPFVSGAESNAVASNYASIGFGGFNTVVANLYLHELFTNDEIDATNPINTDNVHSRRLSASICPKDFEGLYFGVDNTDRNVHTYRGLGLTALVKKYTNWYQGTSEIPLNRSGINFRHIRLADVYLMYAEAVLNENSNVGEAIKYIDLVRKRAGVKTIQQYLDANANTFPQLHISEQVHGTQPMVAPTKENIMTHIQMVERPLELCFEGQRWRDLVRWGMVKNTLTTMGDDLKWRRDNLATILNQPPLFIEGSVNLLSLIGIEKYNAAEHDYFYLPAAEQQSNKGL